VNTTLSAAWGSEFIDQFTDRGRVKKVFIQGSDSSRMLPENFNDWYVRNSLRQMVPFAAFSQGSWIYGSPKLERYNGSASAEILGEPAPGLSTGSAMDTMEKLAEKLPPGIGFDWTGLSYEERAGGSQVGILYAISLTVVFLSLAALYESWSIPVAVILVVPLGILGAVLATFLRGLSRGHAFCHRLGHLFRAAIFRSHFAIVQSETQDIKIMPLLIGLYFQKSANIWKRSHSGRNFHSRNQELIGT
jgi:multidrug efflux pump